MIWKNREVYVVCSFYGEETWDFPVKCFFTYEQAAKYVIEQRTYEDKIAGKWGSKEKKRNIHLWSENPDDNIFKLKVE